MDKKYNRKNIYLLGIIVAIILISLLIFKNNNDLNYNEEKVEHEIERPIENKSITISFAGDVTMGNYKGSSYYGTFDNEFKNVGENFDYFFENVKLL